VNDSNVSVRLIYTVSLLVPILRFIHIDTCVHLSLSKSADRLDECTRRFIANSWNTISTARRAAPRCTPRAPKTDKNSFSYTSISNDCFHTYGQTDTVSSDGQIHKSLFDLNHDWITLCLFDLSTKVLIWKHVIWFGFRPNFNWCGLICDVTKSQISVNCAKE